MQNYPPGGAPNYSPSGMPQGQAPKKSKAPLIIGGVIGCLALIVIIVLALGGLAYFGIKKAEEAAKNINANRNVNGSAPAAERTASAERFVNTRTGRAGNLSKYYVDFSFDYPNTWKLDPDPDPSYVRIERATEEAVTMENFSVGWFGATTDARGNTALLSDVVNKLAGQVSGNFPGFEKVSEGETSVNTYDGYELRFRRNPAGMEEGQLPYWGRVIVLVSEDDPKRGVSLILLATDKAEGVGGLEDVGVAGELSGILNSFRLGSDASK